MRTFTMLGTRRSMTDGQAVTHGLHGRALISSAGGSPARTSASRGDGKGSPVTDPDCGTSSHESLMLFDPAPFSWRTFRGCSARTVAETWVSSSTPWQASGMAWRGGSSTRNTSGCPSGADGCSCSPCLTDILEPSAPPKYWLSATAAAGILRRARARGRAIPPDLHAALTAVVAADASRTPSPTRAPPPADTHPIPPRTCRHAPGCVASRPGSASGSWGGPTTGRHPGPTPGGTRRAATG